MEKTGNYLNPNYTTEFNENEMRIPPPHSSFNQVINIQHSSTSPTAQGSSVDNVSHFSYLSISLSTRSQIHVNSNSVGSKSGSILSSSPAANGSLISPSSSRGSSPLPAQLMRHSQSRPVSPPPATYFPPRRPSLSLPPSPRTLRTHRASLPFLQLPSGRVRSISCSRGDIAAQPPADSRARSPSSPPLISRNTRRRPARTPSPRPPLPPPVPSNDSLNPQLPQSNRPSSQPYKIKMRSR